LARTYAPIWKFWYPQTNGMFGTELNHAGRMLDVGTVQFSPLSLETATAEKFVDHCPAAPHLLTDMKFTCCVVPTEIPAVGIIVTSVAARLRPAITCREKSGSGQIAVDAAEQRVVPPLLIGDAAVAEGVAERDEHLVAGAGTLSTLTDEGRPHATEVVYAVSPNSEPLALYVTTRIPHRLIPLFPPKAIQFQGNASVALRSSRTVSGCRRRTSCVKLARRSVGCTSRPTGFVAIEMA
jgi:hypothetical protein